MFFFLILVSECLKCEIVKIYVFPKLEKICTIWQHRIRCLGVTFHFSALFFSLFVYFMANFFQFYELSYVWRFSHPVLMPLRCYFLAFFELNGNLHQIVLFYEPLFDMPLFSPHLIPLIKASFSMLFLGHFFCFMPIFFRFFYFANFSWISLTSFFCILF